MSGLVQCCRCLTRELRVANSAPPFLGFTRELRGKKSAPPFLGFHAYTAIEHQEGVKKTLYCKAPAYAVTLGFSTLSRIPCTFLTLASPATCLTAFLRILMRSFFLAQ